MNHPSLSDIEIEMGLSIDCGLTSCLNVDTGEVESWLEEPKADESDSYRAMPEKVKDWPNKVIIDPITPQDRYDMRQDFLEENVREGSPLYQHLHAALIGGNPFEDFDREVKNRKGEKIWNDYRNLYLRDIVCTQLVRDIVGDRLVMYPMNRDTIELMAQAYIDGRYSYYHCGSNQVIISQVVYQDNMDYEGDGWDTLDTHYTVTEQVWQMAENQKFYELGGGLTMEPHGLYEGMPMSEVPKPTLAEAIEEIKGSVHWVEEEEKDFQEFCQDEEMVEDLFDSFDLDEEDYYDCSAPWADEYERECLEEHKRSKKDDEPDYDGKYPVYGSPDDEFSELDPTGIQQAHRKWVEEDFAKGINPVTGAPLEPGARLEDFLH